MNKKNYLLGLCVAASATVANAQQLPNVGFVDWKGDAGCGNTLGLYLQRAGNILGYTYTFANEELQRPGDEPSDWNGSSVNQKARSILGTMPASKVLITSSTEGSDNKVAKLQNLFVGLGSIGANAPGFLTLGTPWVFADQNTDICDGGTYGGVEFKYRPDAIAGKFKRADQNEKGEAVEATGELSHIIAYLWSGTSSSKIGQKDSSTGLPDTSVDEDYSKVVNLLDCDDVDKALLGNNNAGAVSGDFKLISSCDRAFSTTDGDWMEIIVPLEYNDIESVPEKMNVIISAGDYWTRGNLKTNTTLLVDDVDFVYYSTLTDLKVNGEAVALVDGTYEYAMSGSALPTEEQVVATTKSQFAKAAVTVDAENAQVLIVVTNQGGKDVDGEISHTYVLQYEKAAEPEQYQGYLNIKIDGSSMAENQAATIEITETGEGKCTFVLPDLTLTGIGNLGDIEVSDVAVTVDDNETKTYAGSVEGMSLMGGAIGADVELNGTIDVNGICDFKIDVLWNSMAGQPMDTPVPINVTFTTNEIPAGVEGINGEAVAVYGVAGAAAIDGYSGAIEVYTADGRLVKSVMVDGNAEIALDGGLYIVRAGGEAYKVFVK